MEIDREAALPLTAHDALPHEIASVDVLEVEALAVRAETREAAEKHEREVQYFKRH